MEIYRVTKIIEFCYGHRLVGHKGKCRYLHGHNARLEVDIESDRLDENGMVIDFHDIRDRVKGWIDAHIDHKMLLWKKDPAIEFFAAMKEPYVAMDDTPTAENIAKMICKEIGDLHICEVRLWETPTSVVTYRPKP